MYLTKTLFADSLFLGTIFVSINRKNRIVNLFCLLPASFRSEEL